MDKHDIVTSFREAKDKAKQIKIMADLHNCSVNDIRAVLREAGVPEDDMRLRAKNKAKANVKPTASRLPGALAALKAEMDALNRRETEIPELINELTLELEGIENKVKSIEEAIHIITSVS